MTEIRKYIIEFTNIGGKPYPSRPQTYNAPIHDKMWQKLTNQDNDLVFRMKRLAFDMEGIDKESDAYRVKAQEYRNAKEARMDIDVQKDAIGRKYGVSGSSYSMLGDKIAPVLGTISDTATLVNNIIAIGSATAYAASKAASWISGINQYIKSKKRKKELDNVQKSAVALVKSLESGDTPTYSKVLKEVASNRLINEHAIKHMFVADVIMAANEAGHPEFIETILREIYKDRINDRDIARLIQYQDDMSFIGRERDDSVNKIARNKKAYQIDIDIE